MPHRAVRAVRDVWWFFFAVLLGHTVLVGANIYRSARNDGLVRHTLRVLANVQLLQSAITDTETGARGFVIVGREEFLEPYNDALPLCTSLIAKLQTLIVDNDPQHERVLALEPIMQKRLDQLRELIAVRRQIPRDPEREIALVTECKSKMDEIRDRLYAISTVERELLANRGRLAAETLNTSIVTTVVGSLLTIGMLALARYLINREVATRRHSVEQLRQSEERFRAIAESLPHLVWTTDSNGNADYFNTRWQEYTGRSEVESLSEAWLGALHRDDRQRTSDRWHQSLKTETGYEVEYRLRRHDRAYRWFLARGMPLRDSYGGIQKWCVTCTDIDDQKRGKELLKEQVQTRTADLSHALANLQLEVQERTRACDQLQAIGAELARSNSDLEQFAYVSSHDLQEPLRKIQAFGDRLRSKFAAQLAEQGREYIDRMLESAGRMRRLIDDLLTFSRVSTKPRPFVPVDLNIAVREVMSDLEDAISRTGGHIEVGPLPMVVGDPAQMRQILQNLLANALKFHKPEEPPVVEVRGSRVEGPGSTSTVVLEVSDHGIGFDPTYAERIFHVFQRLHGRQEYEGTGIGLAIVRKIVERHGGTITAESQSGAGARFRIVLPAEPIGMPTAFSPEMNGV